MYKQILTVATLTLLIAGPAAAANDRQRDKHVPQAQPIEAKATARQGNDDRDRGRGHDRDDDRNDWRGHGRDDIDRDWRAYDRRRDDDWRRRGWHHDGGHNDGWRYYRRHDHRHWRYVPPTRYSVDFGYRSGYELAWRDWQNYGRYDRYWRRNAYYGYGVGYTYRSGYDAGWRDAAYYYGRGYRPNYWSYDPYGGWYFGFSISG
jgi:hypothetical protein